jgi:hypothetical protein
MQAQLATTTLASTALASSNGVAHPRPCRRHPRPARHPALAAAFAATTLAATVVATASIATATLA